MIQMGLKEVERIFRVMQCDDVQKVRFGTHMLAEEADDWWVSLYLFWSKMELW